MIYGGAILLLLLCAAVTAVAALTVWRSGYTQGWRRARDCPPTCPQCGYNMSGLTLSRCPECGREYRLDQLWRATIHARRQPPSPAAGPEDRRT